MAGSERFAEVMAEASVAPGQGNGGGALPGSFEARLQEVRRQREQRTTELFEPPGFEDLFRVEMRVVSFKVLSDIVISHRRQHDESLQVLYINADIVLAATVGFRMLGDDGELLEPERPTTWVDLARAFDPTLGADVRPRVALIRMLEGQGVATLANEWNEWNTRGNGRVERDLERDF